MSANETAAVALGRLADALACVVGRPWGRRTEETIESLRAQALRALASMGASESYYRALRDAHLSHAADVDTLRKWAAALLSPHDRAALAVEARGGLDAVDADEGARVLAGSVGAGRGAR